MRKLVTLILILCAIYQLRAQNAFYKSNFLYAHTFEGGLNDGMYRNAATEDCMTFIGMTVPSVGGPDPKVPVMQTESTGSINQDDSFDPGGLNARCFPQIDDQEVSPIVYNDGNTIIDNLSLSFLFSTESEPNIYGLYFEAGQVNMSGLFETNSNAHYRVVIHEGNIYGPELYSSEILYNDDYWNKFYIPFDGIDTDSWAGKTITFEIRFWNNNEGHPFFRLDDIALIGNTFCDRGNGRIGNMVWEDSNQDGLFNNGESGIPNVPLKLYMDDGDGIFNPDPQNGDGLISMKTTDGLGNYLFENIPDGNFFIVIPESSFDFNESLSGYFPTTGTSVSANSDTDNQDHGIVDTQHKLNGVRSDMLTLVEGTEPTNDGDDANGNLTIDFGFYNPPTMSLGDLVWDEKVEDGLYNVGDSEMGIEGVLLNLYEDSDASNDLSSADILLDQITTNSSGNYQFSGLLDGDYIVEIPISNFDLNSGVLGTFYLTQGNVPTDPDDNINNDNDGVQNGISIVSEPITLALGSEPTDDGDTDNNTNLTVDFGFKNCDPKATIVWQEAYLGASADQMSYAGIRTSDGGFLLGGRSNYFGGDEGVIIKINQHGDTLWTKLIDAPAGTDYVRSIKESVDGYVVSMFSLGDIGGVKTIPRVGGGDYWMLKLDFDGNVLGQQNLGGVDADNLWLTIQTSDNGYLLAGTSSSGVVSGVKSEASDGTDMWIVKLDNAFNIVWENTIGGSGSEAAYGAVESNDGHYVILGTTNSPGDGDITEVSANSDMLIMKLNSSNGTIIWQNSIGGSGNDSGRDLLYHSDGGFVIGGSSNSGANGDKTEGAMGGNDIWLFKVDATGQNIEWQNTIGGNANDYVIDMKQTTDGGFALGCYSRSGINGDKTEANLGSDDYWFVKTDKQGVVEWEKTIGTATQDILGAMDIAENGDYLLLGYTYSGVSGDKSMPSLGSADWWTVMLTAPIETNCSSFGDLSIGDQIWEDTDMGSTMNGTEPGIEKVKVDLFVDNGDNIFNSEEDILLSTTKSDSLGNYLFDSIPSANYFVRVAPENFQGGTGVLNNMCNSPGMVTGNSDTNNADHGTDTQQAGQFGVISSIVTLTENGEPITDGDTDNNSNLTLDFGFYTPPAVMRIGNLVFEDTNNNSFRDTGEPVISGVTVELYQDADGDEMLDTNMDTYITNDITDGSGIYGFDNLSPGKYFVNVPASNWGGVLNGMVNSTAFGGNDFDMDDDDAGVEEMHYDEANQGVASSVLTLEYNAEPDVAVDGDDKQGNMTVDFGFYYAVKLGDLVWEDTDMDGAKGGTESVLEGVRLDLFVDTDNDGVFDKDSDAFYWSTFTDVNGEYCFDRLGGDDYFVRVSPANFDKDKVLEGMCSSPVSYGGNSDLNDRNHGIDDSDLELEGIRSGMITLTFGSEPDTPVDGDDMNGNQTIDFGVMTSQICGLVFHDANESGTYDVGDDLLENVTVFLKDIVTDAIISQTITESDGTYVIVAKTGDYYLEFQPGKNELGLSFGSATFQDATSSSLTDAGDSDIDMLTYRTNELNFLTGDNSCNVDAGFTTRELPVELSYFKAYNSNCDAKLEWVTLSEENNSHFIIEKSEDGVRFEEIARVEGNGNSTEPIEYHYTDERLNSERNFYRLKQVDFDGTYTYSEIQIVALSKDSPCLNPLGTGIVLPNPTLGTFYFEIDLDAEVGNTRFQILDVLGQKMTEKEINLNTGKNRISFEMEQWSPGTYFLTVDAKGGKVNTYRIVLLDK